MQLSRAFFGLLAAASLAGVASAQSIPNGDADRPAAQTVPVLKPTDSETEAALISAQMLTRFHYCSQPLNASMSAKIFDAYLKELDPERVFFTQQDVSDLAKYRTTLGDGIWNQDLSGPFAIFNRYLQRAQDRMSYARSLLKEGFDFTTHDSYVVDRKGAPWPKDIAEMDAVWRDRTMNDWLRLKLAGKNDGAIRDLLDKRYSFFIQRTRQLDAQDAFQTFMTAYANTTDPHTDYFGPVEAQQFNIDLKLSLDGIGIYLATSPDGNTQIAQLEPGSPAVKSGRLHVGDTILAIGQGSDGPLVDVVGWRQEDVIALVRGKRDTEVRLEISPAALGGEGRHEVVSLVRQKIDMAQQAASRKIIDINQNGIDRRIGVIELPSFYSDFRAHIDGDKHFKSASRDVASLLDQLKAEHVQGVVIDLRNNGGGSVYEASALTGLFIDQGPAVQVRDALGKVETEGKDTASPMSWTGPLAVLVNRGTASASEIFAAAIQDYGRGLVVGSPTFGKGTVQILVDLNKITNNQSDGDDLGSLKMTTQEFFRINGGSTQLRGVTPDIEFPAAANEKDYGEFTYDNALSWTQIQPAAYKPVANMGAYLPELIHLHDARDATSPEWKLMNDELSLSEKLADQTRLSLNFGERETERKDLDASQRRFEARQRAIDGHAATDADPLDDGLDAGERSLTSELKLEDEAKHGPDPELHESAHILYDAIGLIETDRKLGALVLPYGGKESTALFNGRVSSSRTSSHMRRTTNLTS